MQHHHGGSQNKDVKSRHGRCRILPSNTHPSPSTSSHTKVDIWIVKHLSDEIITVTCLDCRRNSAVTSLQVTCIAGKDLCPSIVVDTKDDRIHFLVWLEEIIMPHLTGDTESTYRTFRMFSTFYAKENRNNSLEGVQKIRRIFTIFIIHFICYSFTYEWVSGWRKWFFLSFVV